MGKLDFKGSCLCGSVKYKVVAEVKHFYYCHCQRCRKTTGSGHVSNIMVLADAINWLDGEKLLQRYKVPEAERFYNQFCGRCGSSMPRIVRELDAVIIPAGSLDHEIPIKPEARIFWDSRAQWSCSGEQLPVFSEYPPDI